MMHVNRYFGDFWNKQDRRVQMTDSFGPVMQLGYIVEDIDKAALDWVERVGAGPFYRLDSIVLDQYSYRGTATQLELSLCFGYWNDVQIELVRPLSTTDSLYTRALRDCPGKLNHMATLVTDLEAVLNQHKLHDRIVQSGGMPQGQKFVYLDEYLPGAIHLELIQAPAATLQFFTMMKKVAANWQGWKPVRDIASIGQDFSELKAE